MSVGLPVANQVVAEIDPPIVELRPALGAYELVFHIPVRTNPLRDKVWWVSLQSGRVTLQSDTPRSLGVARPDQTEILEQNNASFARTVSMSLLLQPHQLTALEDTRDASDLKLSVDLFGEGGDGAFNDKCWCNLVVVVPRSRWIELMREARVLDVLLLEIPMPIGSGATATQVAAGNHLRQAQTHFANGHHDDCVGACRLAMEAIGAPAGDLDRYNAAGRRAMTKAERGRGMYAAILYFNHPAHHTGNDPYSRAEAKLALQLAAACVAAGAF